MIRHYCQYVNAVDNDDYDDLNGAIAMHYDDGAANVAKRPLSESMIMNGTGIIQAEITTIFCPS